MMKTVNYFGQKYVVPDWTRFMSTDEDGEIYAFNTRPTANASTFCGGVWGFYGEEQETMYERIRQHPPEWDGSKWADSLVEIEE